MRRVRIAGPPGAAVLGLLLGAVALGPGLGRGFLLSYDMVFVPRPPFNAAMFGLSGTLPRAVPSNAFVAAAALALPADIVQKLLLLAIFVLACSGAAALLSGEHWLAGLAAGVFYAWNPFVAERLILGQWALLLGYAGLPWVLRSLTGPARGRRIALLALALVPAAIGGFAAMSISALVAVPAAASAAGQTTGQRLRSVAAALSILTLLSLPWLIPSLARAVNTSPAGVDAFGARADTPFGSVGSLLMLGGAWNAQTVPAGYGGGASAFWLALVLAAVGCYAALGRRRWPGLTVAATVGLALACVGVTGAGRDVLRSMIAFWPGFAILRDGQQFAAPLALAEAAGFGLGVAWLIRPGHRLGRQRGQAVRGAAAALLAAPVILLPGLAWGAAGRLEPVQYPAAWLTARSMIGSDRGAGDVLLLPWAAYRRFGWNGHEAVLDPWPQLLRRGVIWNDGLQIGESITVPPEDPQAIALNRLILSAAPLTGRLRAVGIRYVVVDAGFPQSLPPAAGTASTESYPYRRRLPGCEVVLATPDLVVYRVPPFGTPAR